MNTWLDNQFENFGGRHVTSIDLLISLTKKHSTSFVCLSISLIARLCFGFLAVGHLLPAVCSVIASSLARSMAFLALVSQAKCSALVESEKIACCWEHLVASMALPGFFGVILVNIHSPIIKTFHTNNQGRFLVKDGPHIELDRKSYP